MTEVRWEVFPELDQLNPTTTPIGEVFAPDKATAEQRARFRFGASVVVWAALRNDQAKREHLGPGRLPQRQPRREGNRYRDFAREKREAAKQIPPQTPTGRASTRSASEPLTLGLGDAQGDDRTHRAPRRTPER